MSAAYGRSYASHCKYRVLLVSGIKDRVTARELHDQRPTIFIKALQHEDVVALTEPFLERLVQLLSVSWFRV